MTPEVQPLGVEAVCGIDDVGSGAFAGPIVVCAALFRCGADTRVPPFPGLRDSKELSEKKLRVFDGAIRACSMLVEFALGEATVDEINATGAEPAKARAFERALAGLQHEPELTVVDGAEHGWAASEASGGAPPARRLAIAPTS